MPTPYIPQFLPLKAIDFNALIGLVGASNAALAKYDALIHSLINPNILLSPLIRQEAVMSSRIEGTQATLSEVLEHEAGEHHSKEKSEDIKEIMNYREALTLCREYIVDRPISLNLILQAHRVLMDTVRGRNKSPGEFRRDQNWIGPEGCSIDEASFIPPSPLHLQQHLDNWQDYVQSTDVDPLIQAGILHAQFEVIHPFKDGNGRIGRLLIPLFLCKSGRLMEPAFYISGYLEEHRELYYARLSGVSSGEKWADWLQFFLTGVVTQATRETEKVKRIMSLYSDMKDRVQGATHSQYSHKAVDAIFERPIMSGPDFTLRSKIPKPTSTTIIRVLKEAKILKTLRPAAGRRAEILVFPELMALIK